MRQCRLCHRTDTLERHHIFGGPCRKASEKYGMVVDLCHWCHNEPPNGAHHNRETDLMLKRDAQNEFEKTHTRNEFRAIFRKSYL
ncbi:MAG: hypothetical protein PHQ85_08900 [Eubacteriales bacterium]|nr:hypothetical protein [Eubacteriales bacterium]MDD4106010.1 hypothetical protein [Eubacteriales bacterium]